MPDKSNRSHSNLRVEEQTAAEGFQLIAGIDEAGRGALAGPVVAAAVVIYPRAYHPVITDSKRLSPARRAELYDWIEANALSIGVGEVDAATIDRVNILQATFMAMRKAVDEMTAVPDFILVDGRDFPFPGRQGAALIKGDLLSFSIACASIVAKVTRDRILIDYDQRWPHYRFAQHKGYGTAVHLQKLHEQGPVEIHRDTFLHTKKKQADTVQSTFWEES
jgi:ribonuclease HII